MKRIHTVTVEFKVEVDNEVFDPSNYYNLANDVVAQRAAADLVANCCHFPEDLQADVANVDTALELNEDEKAALAQYNKDEDDDWNKRHNGLEELGAAHGIKRSCFSMSEVPVEEMNNPLGMSSNDGKVRFSMRGDDNRDYLSDIVINPTMMDAWKAFDDSIEVTGDDHHIFLEGLQPVGMAGDTFIVTFVTGS